MMRSLLLFLALVLSTAAMPQPSSSSVPVPSAASSPSWEQLFRDWMTLEDASYGEETFELLAGLAENKLNLPFTSMILPSSTTIEPSKIRPSLTIFPPLITVFMAWGHSTAEHVPTSCQAMSALLA